MRAMILAAGYGTRLWPLTIDRAKPALPFMNRPLVGYVAEYLARYGCREVVVNLHHRPDSVRAALGDGARFGVRLRYVHEREILGTSGALDNAKELLDAGTFVVVNGKIATDIDLGAALDTHRRTGALATLVLRPNRERERYSTVQVADGLVIGFGPAPIRQASDNADDEESGRNPTDGPGRGRAVPAAKVVIGDGEGDEFLSKENTKPAGEGAVGSSGGLEARLNRGAGGVSDEAPLMFTGIQILEPRIFDFIPRGVFSHSTTDVYPKAWRQGERVVAHVAEGHWYELSTVPRYLDTSVRLMRLEGRDVELGDGSVVEEGAEVRESVLWENVTVERGARVRRAVLGAGVRVAAGETLEDVAVVRAELARGVERPEKGLAGEFRGANFVAPLPR